MSKLAKAINAKIAPAGTSSKPLKYLEVKFDATEFLTPQYCRGTELYIGVEAYKHVVLPSSVDLEDAIKDIKRAIIEEVFGEFRPLIYDMRAALYGDSNGDLRKLLGELEDAMFHDGV